MRFQALNSSCVPFACRIAAMVDWTRNILFRGIGGDHLQLNGD
jgi:hypothetical protein